MTIIIRRGFELMVRRGIWLNQVHGAEEEDGNAKVRFCFLQVCWTTREGLNRQKIGLAMDTLGCGNAPAGYNGTKLHLV